MDAQAQKARLSFDHRGDALECGLAGDWLLAADLPDFAALRDLLEGDRFLKSVLFTADGLGRWDSGLPVFLLRCRAYCAQRRLAVDFTGLPADLRRLLDLALAVPEKKDARRDGARRPWLERVGLAAWETRQGAQEALAFVGGTCQSLARLCRGRAWMRRRDLWTILEEVSVRALPIVALISFLVGLIIAFLGAVVLRKFGASYYVSYLVGYGMLREMGAVMTGVIMAGRTGAAFAAQIGSMKITEEIDALRTLGISPFDFVVLPRLLALFVMMPLLTIYADLVGMVGGFLVSGLMLDLPPEQFFAGLNTAVDASDFLLGLFKGTVFGVIVAGAGCLRGLQCQSSAGAVGQAATSAVVTGITLLITANAAIDWLAAIFDV